MVSAPGDGVGQHDAVPDSGERVRPWDDIKRRVYLACLALTLPTIPLVMWVRFRVEPVLLATYSVLLVVLVTLLVGLATRLLSVRAFEVTVLTSLFVAWIVRLIAMLYVAGDVELAAEAVNQSMAPAFAILAVLAFLAFDVRRSAQVAGGFVAIYAMVVAPRVTAEIVAHGWTPAALGLLRVIITSAVLVGLLVLLARYKQSLVDVSARAEHDAALARTDALTGLLNRRAMFERFATALELAGRHGRPLSVAIVDIDLFKQVNDTAGHAAGDQVLCAVAGVLNDALRASDIVARIGGDEFLVVLPETGAEPAAMTMQRLLETVANSVTYAVPDSRSSGADAVANVTLSIGVAQRRLGDSPDDLVARADDAMYRAKKLGRNRIEIDPRGLAPLPID